MTTSGARRAGLRASAALAWVLGLVACGGGGGGGPPPIEVQVTPPRTTVLAGETAQFTASVTGTTDAGVTWSVSGAACAGSGCGAVSDAGLYQAPPQPSAADLAVVVRATSKADPSRSGAAQATVPAVSVTVTPASPTVALGATSQLTAAVGGTREQGVTWALAGPGRLSSTGRYEAPATLGTPASAVATATSVVDPTKSGRATIQLPSVAVEVTPAQATVFVDDTRAFTAMVANAADQAVDWTLAGPGCPGPGCGAIDLLGRYTPPPTVAADRLVQVVARPRADPTKPGLATVTVPPVGVTVSPAAPAVTLGATRAFTATVTNAVDGGVTWSVSGSGCSGAGCGEVAAAGTFTAPARLTTPATLTVTAASRADPSRSASATVTIPAVAVSLSPPAPAVILGASRQLTATVTDATDQTVTWSLAGPGALDDTGRYTAPDSLATPATATVTATSHADPTKSASVTVAIPAVGIALSPADARVILGASQPFTATVTSATDGGVTWALAGTGCSGAGCGAVDAAGLFRTADHLVTPLTITVTARPRADPTKSASATVSVPVVAVSLYPASTRMAPARKRWHVPTVVDAVDTGVTWTVTGAGCSGLACGSVDTEGRYHSPPTPPSPDTVTVAAASVADPTKSAASPVTISLDPNARLSGEFVFFLRGVELLYTPGAPFQQAGRFVADGDGHLREGVRDLVATTSRILDEPVSGTYEVLDGDLGTWTLPPMRVAAFSLRADGEGATLIDYDHTGLPMLAGVLVRQDPRPVAMAPAAGDFVGLLGGGGAGDLRAGAVGRVHLDGAGGLSAIAFDASDGGAVQAWSAAAGSYTVGAGGHGSAVLGLPVATADEPMSLYAVDADRLLLVSTAAVKAGTPLLSGFLVRQAGGPFSTGSLAAPVIFWLEGRVSADWPSVAIGRLAPDGLGGLTGTFERNEAGVITLAAPLTGSYQVAASGRGTLDTGLGSFAFWLTAPGRAVLLESPGARVQTGHLETQVGAPFEPTGLSGRFASATLPPATATTLALAGWGAYDGATNTAAYFYKDASGPHYGQGSAPYALAPEGRGMVGEPGHAIFWLVSPDKMVQLHTAPLTPSHAVLYVAER